MDNSSPRGTWAEGADAIGESGGAAAAEISGEEGKPRGEELGGDLELGGLVADEERVDGVGHGSSRSRRRVDSGELGFCLGLKTGDR